MDGCHPRDVVCPPTLGDVLQHYRRSFFEADFVKHDGVNLPSLHQFDDVISLNIGALISQGLVQHWPRKVIEDARMLYEYGKQAGTVRGGKCNRSRALLSGQGRPCRHCLHSFRSLIRALVPRRGSRPWGAGSPGDTPAQFTVELSVPAPSRALVA
ncbi:hypothetical protein VUR80DRAFT_6284 [Thermomyces stellatus]